MKYNASIVVMTLALISLTDIWFQPFQAGEDQVRGEKVISPITVDLTKKIGFASFTNRQHPDNRIGYRFFEHSPLVFGTTPKSAEQAGIVDEEQRKIVEELSARQGTIVYEQRIEKKNQWLDHNWKFYMAPVEDGIDMLWVIETGERGLPQYYGVQQCFRMSGKSNADWRRTIAETPAFSEYDLWESQKDTKEKTSLSWVLRNDTWQALPAIIECVGARTPSGLRIDKERFADNLPGIVGPYEALLLDPVDCGLITRADLDGKWVCGIYWEGTSHVTNHHPADCLHAIVNIGNVPAHSKRVIRGKIYWFKGSKDDLLEKWRRDFLYF
jgi:hypothetical protein